jgi:regulator of sirC expression with transglutaminase-like and TPR domain
VLDAVLLVAKHAHPELDVAVVKQQLDDLAAQVEAGLPAGVRYPLRVIKEINKVLYEVQGFSGNTEDYCECLQAGG